MFKLNCPALSRMPSPACEGLWDHIQYLITSDRSISEKIGNMLYQMDKMTEEQKTEFESLKIPFKMVKIDGLKKIMSFSASAVDFVTDNVRKYEGKAFVMLANEKHEIQNEVESAASSFESQHNIDEIDKLLDNEGAEDDRTYQYMGYKHSDIKEIAKEFKESQAGRLTRMRKMKFINYMAAHGMEGDKVKVVNKACMRFVKLLNKAMDCYTYVNKFLFFTYKELLRKGLIQE